MPTQHSITGIKRPNSKGPMGQSMTLFLPFFIMAIFLLSSCTTIGFGLSTGSRNTRVGVYGSTGGAGIAVSKSAHGDFLYSDRGKVYSDNKRGFRFYLDGEYEKAKEVFEQALEKSGDNPDSVYYLGLTLIYLGDRDAGYDMLATYRDDVKVRTAQEVRWWTGYCRKRPELEPDKIRDVLNKARQNGYQQDLEEERERRSWGL